MSQDTATSVGAVSAEVEANRRLILSARGQGPAALLKAFARLSGPGWLQSAITLGGGSLASSLYLGVLSGFALLWLQPVAMIIGVIMLSTISYVTLSTGERPFQAINRHISPVLGWGWLLATMMANLVWSMPQFSLATAAVRQNLLPRLFEPIPETAGKLLVGLAIALFCSVVVLLYDRGQRGARLCDVVLKLMVALIVVAFFGVVIKLSLASEVPWARVFAGLVPDLRLLSRPPASLQPYIAAVAEPFQPFWTNLVVADLRGVMIAAAATAVGINMTFLLPYSMLRRGWDRDFRGMAVFDLATGLFVPFVLVTGCVVLVAALQFHSRPAPGLLGERDVSGAVVAPEKKLVGPYNNLLRKRLATELGAAAVAAMEPAALAAQLAAMPEADRRMAAMLVQRDAFALADSLTPLTGRVYAHYVFGLGVVGMAVSSIIILMMINGFVVCEMVDCPCSGWLYRGGCLMPLVGILGPFIWRGGKAQFWLAVPTSNIAFVLIPLAYLTFAFMLNSPKLLGAAMPRGAARIACNLLVVPAASLAAAGSVWKLWSGLRWTGLGILAAFLLLCAIVHQVRRSKAGAAVAAAT
jgi:Mn2+/Fe2+ NRAMP family transporter